jgi:ubiquinone/menaquinone biosynthesis C-methylase UbiE
MKLNFLEFWLMNNPVRGLILRKFELPRLRKFFNLRRKTNILEIGCGNGKAAKLIKTIFKPMHIIAIDLDEKMIAIAKRKFNDSDIEFKVGDASKLKYENNSFDAIFDFGIIHHIPNWKDCLSELKRVLKPEGQLIIEDLSIDTFKTPIGRILRLLLKHPYKEMYNQKEFMKELKELGFKIETQKTYHPLWLVKYFIVIAKK